MMKRNIGYKIPKSVGYALLAVAAVTAVVYIVVALKNSNSAFLLLIASSATAVTAAYIIRSQPLNKLLCRVFFWLFIEFFLRAAIYGRSDFFEYTVFEADARRLKYYFIHRVNLVPFKSISLFFSLPFSAIFTNIFGNIGLIVPVSFLSPIAYPTKKGAVQAFFSGFGLSLFVELSQFYFMCGAFDVDDVILNSAGALIGAVMFHIFSKNKKKTYIFT